MDTGAYRPRRRPASASRYFGGARLSENPLHWLDMTTLRDLDLGELIADTEHEILRVLQLHDASVAGAYEQIRYHLGLDGADGPRGKRMRPLLGLLAYASIAGDHERALPGAAAVELGHNFSLVHDDIEDSDTERHHRPTLWAVHGIPQAINTGDLLFSLSRIALHRPVGPGLLRLQGPPPDAPVRPHLRRAVRGPVPGHRDVRRRPADVASSCTSR